MIFRIGIVVSYFIYTARGRLLRHDGSAVHDISPVSISPIVKAPKTLTIQDAERRGAGLMQKIKDGNNAETRFTDYDALDDESWSVAEVDDVGYIADGICE